MIKMWKATLDGLFSCNICGWTKRTNQIAALLFLLPAFMQAQDFHKLFVDAFGDSFRPRGSSRGLFSTAGAGGIIVGFRPFRYFQIDGVGVEFMAKGTGRLVGYSRRALAGGEPVPAEATGALRGEEGQTASGRRRYQMADGHCESAVRLADVADRSQTRYLHPLAPQRIPAVLALEVEAHGKTSPA